MHSNVLHRSIHHSSIHRGQIHNNRRPSLVYILVHLLSIVATLGLATVPAHAGSAPTEHLVSVQRVLAPSGYNREKEFVGYDNNDDIWVTALGTLPNTCHRVGQGVAEVSGTKIILKQSAYEYKGKNCIQTKIPYANNIRVGVVPKADPDYSFVDGDTKKEIGKIEIPESPVADADSDLYLNVTDARLVYDGVHKKWHAIVVGMHSAECTKLKTVKIDILEKARSIVVRPIMEVDRKVPDSKCDPTDRLQHSEEIPYDLKGIWLLHVRSVHGAAKHELIDAESYKIP